MKLQIVFALATFACVALCNAYPDPEPEPLFGIKDIATFFKDTANSFKDLTPQQIIEKLSKDAIAAFPFGNKIQAAIDEYKNLTPQQIMDKIKALPFYKEASGAMKDLEEKLDAILNVK